MPSDKDREEARRREAMDFARKIFKTFTGELQAHPIDITFERDARIRAEAKAEALREAAERFCRECDIHDDRSCNHPPNCWRRIAILSASPGPDEVEARECAWTEDADGLRETLCGRSWTFIEGGPRENGVRYCYGCGKPVRIADETNKEEQ